MATLNELISELKTFEDITNHRKFMRKVNEFIKKHGYTHLGNGAYTEAYSNGTNNILKYCPNPVRNSMRNMAPAIYNLHISVRTSGL